MCMRIPSKMIMYDNCPQDQDFLFWYQTVVVATVVFFDNTFEPSNIHVHVCAKHVHCIYSGICKKLYVNFQLSQTPLLRY